MHTGTHPTHIHTPSRRSRISSQGKFFFPAWLLVAGKPTNTFLVAAQPSWPWGLNIADLHGPENGKV